MAITHSRVSNVACLWLVSKYELFVSHTPCFVYYNVHEAGGKQLTHIMTAFPGRMS